jgi:release factor glutamine methyltransferase
MRLSDAIAGAARRLTASSETPRLDGELLMAHALGVEREAMLLGDMAREVPAAFEALVERRVEGEPLAYIVGRRAFWTIDLRVGPGVLIPRPDSETLIEAAVDHFKERAPLRILDLGTGPGTLLLAALAQWPHSHGLGIDRSHVALDLAFQNACDLELDERVRFRPGDWARGLEGEFDLILCNPPYVETGADLPVDVAQWEPSEALFAGTDGLSEYRRLAPDLPRLVAPGGLACLELGAGRLGAVAALFEGSGLTLSSRKDLRGVMRCLLLSR